MVRTQRTRRTRRMHLGSVRTGLLRRMILITALLSSAILGRTPLCRRLRPLLASRIWIKVALRVSNPLRIMVPLKTSNIERR
ncbi:hypothetical protein F443_22433, partial [Phytophthora nicotianae P1569]